MADILDVTQPNEKRKQLLAWLMQQVGQGGAGNHGALAAAASASPAARSQSSGRSIFNRSDARGGGVNVTQSDRVSAGLRSALGPGGFGLSTAAERSSAPGMPVPRPADPGMAHRRGADGTEGLSVQAPPPRTGAPGASPADPGSQSFAAPANPLSPADPSGGGFSVAPAVPSMVVPANTIQSLTAATSKPAPSSVGGGVFGGMGGIAQAVLLAALSQMIPDVNTNPHVASPEAQARGGMGSFQAL